MFEVLVPDHSTSIYEVVLFFCFVAQPLGSCAVHFEVECGLVLGSLGRAGVLGRSLVWMLC